MSEFQALTVNRMLDFVYSNNFSHYDVDFSDMVKLFYLYGFFTHPYITIWFFKQYNYKNAI